MVDEPELIEFQAAVTKVQTLADNGIRVTFDLSEQSVMALAKLATCQQAGAYLKIVATPFMRESFTDSDHAAKKTTENGAAPMGGRGPVKRRDRRTSE